MQELEELKNKTKKVRTGLYIDEPVYSVAVGISKEYQISVNETLTYLIRKGVEEYKMLKGLEEYKESVRKIEISNA